MKTSVSSDVVNDATRADEAKKSLLHKLFVGSEEVAL